MLSMSCTHPDIEDFIKIKSDLNEIEKANISVRVTDEFMISVIHNRDIELSFTREETGETISKVINAYELFRLIAEMNWDYAEPGILFWEAIQSYNLLETDPEFSYAATNPCGEEPLPAGGSCLLGSINLSSFVREDKDFDFADFSKSVEISVKALNDVLEEGLDLHPLEEQRKSVSDWRQIGLGIFGLADMLIKMEIIYGSERAVELCDLIGQTMANTALITSCMIAKEKGPYPKFKADFIKDSSYFKKHCNNELAQKFNKYGLRNSQLLTIAPTGTLSTMLGVSGGIEPIYDTHYFRTTKSLHDKDVTYKIYTPIVKRYIEENNLQDETKLPEYFITAKKIHYKNRINMQAIWQKHIDASISSTINVPNKTSIEDIINLYVYAWERELKGVTIFREECKRTAILNSSTPQFASNLDNFNYNSIIPIKREEVDTSLTGHTYIKKVACGKMYITINHDNNGRMLEVFVNSGKSGGCSANTECLGRYASAALRSGVKIDNIIDITKGVKCPACISAKGKGTELDGISCGDVIARTIQEEYEKLQNEFRPEKTKEDKAIDEKANISLVCPECGNSLINEGGCNVCKNCGWSKCSG